MSRLTGGPTMLAVDRRRLRRTIAEKPNWSLSLVPFLSTLCLDCIVKHFEETPIYEELTLSQKDYVQERLPLSLPLSVTANLVDDGIYWRRACEQRWDICDVSHYNHSWKRMFFERHLENILEHFIPETTSLKTVTDEIPLCEAYVKRLDISQMLPPIKENKGDAIDWLSETDSDAAHMEHYDFRSLLKQLSCLEEFHLTYRVKHCGMNFEWKMTEMAQRDCETLAMALQFSKTLKVVQLYESHIDDEKCKLLAKHLMTHPSLLELNLSHNVIEDKGAKAISNLINSSKLEILNLSDNIIRDVGANAIAKALFNNSTLLSLNLRINRVTDNGGLAIAKALVRNRTLLHLHLGANLVTEPTAIMLSEVLVKNQTLKTINLSCNKLGVDGGKALGEAIVQNSCLTECDVRLTDIDEQSASVINQVVCTNRNASATNQVLFIHDSDFIIDEVIDSSKSDSITDEVIGSSKSDSITDEVIGTSIQNLEEEQEQGDEVQSQGDEVQPQGDEVQPQGDEVQPQDEAPQEQDDVWLTSASCFVKPALLLSDFAIFKCKKAKHGFSFCIHRNHLKHPPPKAVSDSYLWTFSFYLIFCCSILMIGQSSQSKCKNKQVNNSQMFA
ncbi:uncharacterized protein drc5 isoform 1-T2 [Syngnathus typhle]